MSKVKVITVILALITGAFGASIAAPRWLDHRALGAIASTEADVREAAWRRWLAPDAETGATPAACRLEDLRTRLASAPDDALLHGAAALRAHGLWAWGEAPWALPLRELELRAALDDEAERLVAAETIRDAPTGVEPARLAAVVDTLLADAPDPVATVAFAAACGWAEPERVAWLEDLTLPARATRLRRLRDLAPGWGEPHGTPPTSPAAPGAVPVPGDDTIAAAALAAERELPHPAATARAEMWIRSFDDDEKRAGALLAALLGEHVQLLRHAHEIEDVATVRTTQRLALWALAPTGDDEGPELAHRALRRADGDFREDTALCLLLAGRAAGLALLTRLPADADAAAVARRDRLIERFAPAWSSALGRPPTGSDAAVRRHFELLETRRLLTARRVRFDRASRTFDDGLPARPPTVNR